PGRRRPAGAGDRHGPSPPRGALRAFAGGIWGLPAHLRTAQPGRGTGCDPPRSRRRRLVPLSSFRGLAAGALSGVGRWRAPGESDVTAEATTGPVLSPEYVRGVWEAMAVHVKPTVLVQSDAL